jgi:uncharacterized SAM-binding protein YcdF (DUF218 family)
MVLVKLRRGGRAASRSSTIARLALPGLAVYGLLLLIILHTPATEWLAQPLHFPPDVHQADAIVVLDAWASVNGDLNESGVRRSLHGAELYRSGVAPVLVLTGSRERGADGGSGLKPMRDLVRLGGVPDEHIVLEEESRDTHESAEHVGALSRSHQWTRIALVTDAMHMRRAMQAFQKNGLIVFPAPVLAWDIGGAQPSLRLRRVGALTHEYGGLLYYWWRGWI